MFNMDGSRQQRAVRLLQYRNGEKNKSLICIVLELVL